MLELVEAYPISRSNIPFDIGSQKHSPAQGDAHPRHAVLVSVLVLNLFQCDVKENSNRHPMFVLHSLKSEYRSSNEGCGRAGNQSFVIEPASSFGMIDLPTSTS